MGPVHRYPRARGGNKSISGSTPGGRNSMPARSEQLCDGGAWKRTRVRLMSNHVVLQREYARYETSGHLQAEQPLLR